MSGAVPSPARPSGVVVVGDSLLDRDIEGEVRRICPDSAAPVLDEAGALSRPGGAALVAAVVAALGRTRSRVGGTVPVTLVTPACDDGPGRELASLLDSAGVRVVPVPARGATPEKIRLRSHGQTLVRLDRGTEKPDLGPLPDRVPAIISQAGAVLVADYGRGATASKELRAALEACGRPIVWDPHPRGAEPVRGCRILTPNASEVLARWAPAGATPSLATLTAAALRAIRTLGADGVAVTRGGKGALLVAGEGPPLAVPVVDSHGGDTCGAGDCFSASVGLHLATGALPSEAVTRAVADASVFVGAGGAAAYPDSLPADPVPRPPAADPTTVAERVRAGGGTVVAAGGCFDLLHAGHVSMLQAARALGDCLIVCLNSDRSVSRLKGPGRPVNPEQDRAATLAALDCVDAVAIFDDETPERVIRSLRPDVWVKGGDYDARRLPEAATLAEWGGQAVVLPYLAGRSTTGILARAAVPAH